MLTESGVDVDVAFITRGEQGLSGAAERTAEAARQMAEVRTREAQAACGVLGVRSVYFLEGSDTRVRDEPHLAERIAGLLKNDSYGRVFCPWPHDAHEDHKATFHWLTQAVTLAQQPISFWLYEIWKPLPANTFVPIDRTLEAKRQAIEQYQSQLGQLNYREGFLGLAAYRSLFCPASTHAEAFLVCQPHEVGVLL